MRCFYHGDVEAVAVCKACFRAICHDCCAEAGSSTACRNRCETEVISIDDLRRRGTKMAGNMSKLYYGMTAFFVLVGGATLLGGVLSIGTQEFNPSGIVFGLFLVAGGIGCFLFARRVRK